MVLLVVAYPLGVARVVVSFARLVCVANCRWLGGSFCSPISYTNCSSVGWASWPCGKGVLWTALKHRSLDDLRMR